MASKLLFILSCIREIFSFFSARIGKLLTSHIHRSTYKAVPTPKNVVIIGGSFAGWMLADSLASSLPTGWKVVLIEKNSNFNFTWLWPRMVAVPGHNHKSFIPYPDKPAGAPEGIFTFIQGTVDKIEEDRVTLVSGENINYSHLCVATGSSPRFPQGLAPSSKSASVEYFGNLQNQVKTAQRIVLVGGGPVGVEIATDAKTRYPKKDVVLIHSRDRLANNFGRRVHEAAMTACNDLKIRMCLDERPAVPADTTHSQGSLVLKSGEKIEYDLLINCTGQRANPTIFTAFSPTSIATDGGIMVDQYLRVIKSSLAPDKASAEAFTNIFALGDVTSLPKAVTGGLHTPKMGRPAALQGMLVAENIAGQIKGKSPKPYRFGCFDRGLKLTLGLDKHILYMTDGRTELLFKQKAKAKEPDTGDDLGAETMWKMLGRKPFEDEEVMKHIVG